MKSIDYRLLAKQFSDLVEARRTLRIPTFSPNNTLGDAVHHLAEAIPEYSADITAANAIERLFIEMERVEQEPHVQEFVFEPIEKMATVFADRINASFKALSTYHAMVESINDAAVAKTKQSIDANPFLREALQQPAATELTYPKLNWNDGYVIPGFSEQEVVNTAHQRSGRTDSMPSVGVAQVLLNEVNLLATKNGYATIALPTDTVQNLITRISAKVPGISETKVGLYINRLLSMSAFLQNVAYTTKDFFAAEGAFTADACCSMVETAQLLGVLLPILDDNTNWDLSPDTMTKVRGNLEIYKKFINVCLYLFTYYRRSVFKDTILLPNSCLNMDNYDTFFGREGATPVMLRDYVAVVFPGDIYRNTIRGVLVDEVFEKKDQVAKRIEQGKQAIATKLVFEHNGVKRRALILAMLEFANSAPADLPRDPDVDIKRLAEVKAQKVVAGDADFRVGIYEFLFQAYLVNPFSVILYENIGLQYTKMLATTTQLDELTLCSMEITVVAKLIQMFTMKMCCQG